MAEIYSIVYEFCVDYACYSLKLPYLNEEIKKVNKRKIINLLLKNKFINTRDKTVSKFLFLLYDIDASLKIEAGIFEYVILYIENGNINMSMFPSIYEDKTNDIFDNLTPKSTVFNPKLLAKLNNNEINPQTIAFLTPQQINEENWSYATRKMNLREDKKKNIATTDFYQCYKCGERKCQITEMQTRSADEPITKFITCLVCSNVFKK